MNFDIFINTVSLAFSSTSDKVFPELNFKGLANLL